jgi:hypothetical protein
MVLASSSVVEQPEGNDMEAEVGVGLAKVAAIDEGVMVVEGHTVTTTAAQLIVHVTARVPVPVPVWPTTCCPGQQIGVLFTPPAGWSSGHVLWATARAASPSSKSGGWCMPG